SALLLRGAVALWGAARGRSVQGARCGNRSALESGPRNCICNGCREADSVSPRGHPGRWPCRTEIRRSENLDYGREWKPRVGPRGTLRKLGHTGVCSEAQVELVEARAGSGLGLFKEHGL